MKVFNQQKRETTGAKWPIDNSGVRVYCESCKETVPAHIEPIEQDSLNEHPWGDIVCTKCALVLATLSADCEGKIVFVKEKGETNGNKEG